MLYMSYSSVRPVMTCLLWVRLARDLGCACDTLEPLRNADLDASAKLMMCICRLQQ